jgi:hypothetical protein
MRVSSKVKMVARHTTYAIYLMNIISYFDENVVLFLSADS